MGERLEPSGYNRKTLAAALGRSSEHIRKLLAGEAFPGPDLTPRIATVLRIDPVRFSDTVNRDKWVRKTGKRPPISTKVGVPTLERIWPKLTEEQQRVLTCVATCLTKAAR